MSAKLSEIKTLQQDLEKSLEKAEKKIAKSLNVDFLKYPTC